MILAQKAGLCHQTEGRVGQVGAKSAGWRGSSLQSLEKERAGGIRRPPSACQKTAGRKTGAFHDGGARGGGSPPRMGSNAPQSLVQQGFAARAAGTFAPRCGAKVTALSGLSKKSPDFFDRLHSAVAFAPRCGAKVPAAQAARLAMQGFAGPPIPFQAGCRLLKLSRCE